MNEYGDIWSLLTKPTAPGPLATATAATAPRSAQPSADESYRNAWREGLPVDDWVRQQSEAIRKEIDGSESTAVLRQGSKPKPKEVAAEAAAAAAEAAGNNGNGGNVNRGDAGGGGDGSGGGSGNGGGPGKGGGHSGTNSLSSDFSGIGKTAGGILGGLSGIPGGSMLGAKVGSLIEGAINSMGPVGVANYGVDGLDGTTSAATGPGTIGSRDNFGSNEGAPGTGSGPNGTGLGGGLGDSPGEGPAGGKGEGSGSGGDTGSGPDGSGMGGGNGDSPGEGPSGGKGAGGDSGWSKGGIITKAKLSGSNPTGPDDGFGALDAGEYVIRTSSVNRYGADVMAALNAGRLPVAEVRKLLNS